MSIAQKLLAALVVAAPMSVPAAAPALPQLAGVEWRAQPAPIEDFTLTDQNGRAARFSSLRGKTVLVFFGFTNCPDICPTTMHELHLTSMSTRVDVTKLQVLMISVDGKRDTPAALRAFLATQSQRFMAMTGEPARLAAIAARFPAVFVLPPEAATARSYNVAHTGAVYLIDAQGRLRATMSKASVNDMARATQIVQQGVTRRG